MPPLSDAERAELDRLRGVVGEGNVEAPTRIEPGFGPIDPMLAETFEGSLDIVDEETWIAETKYDGTRLIVQVFDGEARAYTRRGVERADDLGAVSPALTSLPDGVIVDGEMTFLDADGVSLFVPIHANPERLEGLTARLFLFDVLYHDEDVTGLGLLERKEHLDDIVPANEDRIVSAPREESAFQAFYDEVTEPGGEGLVLKRRGSRYHPGVRSSEWLKVKRFRERDAIVVGYTPGEGGRAGAFGSLVLTDGQRCIGRVGSGFSEQELEAVLEVFEPTDERRVSRDAAGGPYTPVEPFVVQVKFQEVTGDGKLRAPVFLRRRPEIPLEDVEPIA